MRHAIELSVVLGRSARRIEAALQTLEAVERSVGALLERSPVLGPSEEAGLQGLDSVSQEIAALGQALQTIARQCQREWTIDMEEVCAAVPLERLQLVLLGEPRRETLSSDDVLF